MRPLLFLSLASGAALAAGQDGSKVLKFSQPTENWEKQSLPIGNGTIGANLFGGVDAAKIQFTVDSMWTGGENPSGSYAVDKFGAFQAFGNLLFTQAGSNKMRISSPDSGDSGAQSVDKTIDGKTNTKWCIDLKPNQQPVWKADFTKAKKITHYSLTAANDIPNRDPYTWKLEGSADGEKWFKLDQRTKQQPLGSRGVTKPFKLKKPASYPHYRLTFIPRPQESHFQIAEIALGSTSNTAGKKQLDNYSRSLDIAHAQHTTSWTQNGVNYTREAIASNPDQVIAWKISADKPGSLTGTFSFTGEHKDSDKFSASGDTIQMGGQLTNNGLDYDARAKIILKGGSLKTEGAKISVKSADSILVLLAADTNYVLDLGKNWMDGKASQRTTAALNKASKLSWEQLKQRHLNDYQSLYNRVALDLGSSDTEVSNKDLDKRIQNYRSNAKDLPRPCLDPELEALMFNYGRYLLISSSRQGTLPANLQGIWNNTNNPPWRGDYHTNINLQMNYWLAETANLPELAKPLFNMYSAQTPVFRKHTIKEYGDTPGFVTRMSTNPFGGGGWNWNIEGTAWIAQHYYEHFKFSGDKEFLKEQAYPWLRDVSKFWLPRLKKLPSGELVVPNAWSHEHGPHEDGTAHAQQLMWDLFTNTANAAQTLGVDKSFQKELRKTIDKLYGPKIGSWGQLMEWMGEKDLEKGNHRHTSHLYAIFPGVQIGKNRDPELTQAAIVSLTKRGEVGDSRRSWTWAWRTALWARLGNAERAHGCVAGLLAYNTLDNLWTTHPPFQIDGNFGITAGIAECLLQSHEAEISLLPALPKAWPTGSVKGLRARYNTLVDIEWKDGKLTKAILYTPGGKTPKLRIQGKKANAKTDRRIQVLTKK